MKIFKHTEMFHKTLSMYPWHWLTDYQWLKFTAGTERYYLIYISLTKAVCFQRYTSSEWYSPGVGGWRDFINSYDKNLKTTVEITQILLLLFLNPMGFPLSKWLRTRTDLPSADFSLYRIRESMSPLRVTMIEFWSSVNLSKDFWEIMSTREGTRWKGLLGKAKCTHGSCLGKNESIWRNIHRGLNTFWTRTPEC